MAFYAGTGILDAPVKRGPARAVVAGQRVSVATTGA